ncbi:hypothetical protein C8Q79DRAFT_1006291 [Trametes meyenii]|nr:hypothetical protein C8Q79DRAFT_1006291 [Trametes meyenii]
MRPPASRKPGLLPPPHAQIFEISDNESSSSSEGPSSLEVIQGLERTVDQLKQRLDEFEADRAIQQRAVASAEQREKEVNERFSSFFMAMDNQMNCQICAAKMWAPYTLACGHTFCKRCLQAWFADALERHKQSVNQFYNPQYVIPPPLRNMLSRFGAGQTPEEQRRTQYKVWGHLATVPQPAYSCPSCRAQLITRPVENFTVKYLVYTICTARGESVPADEHTPVAGNRPVDPWNTFFPSLRG